MKTITASIVATVVLLTCGGSDLAFGKRPTPTTGTMLKPTSTKQTSTSVRGAYTYVTTSQVKDYASAACPSTLVLLGGGCSGVGGDGLITSRPSGNTWICSFKPRPTPLRKTAYAICGARPAGHALVSANRTANYASINCPGAKMPLGGGCGGVGGDAAIACRPAGRAWLAQFAPRATPLRKEAHAICADRPAGYAAVQHTATANVASATCPSGKILIGGGCHGVGGDAILASRPSGDTWICQFSPRTTPLSKTATVLCASR
jgi:hypothetical protein